MALLRSRLSMLDTIGEDHVRYLLVYQKADARLAWFTWFLDREFEHVEVWRDLGDGIYLALMPCHDYMKFELVQGAPEGRIQQVLARRKRGTPMLPLGLKTCVSVVKAAIGLRNARIVTPKQLYQYVAERNGVV